MKTAAASFVPITPVVSVNGFKWIVQGDNGKFESMELKKDHIGFGITLILVLMLSACAKAGELIVRDAWARPGNVGGNSAVYFVISNNTNTDDILLSASTDVAPVSEIHLSKVDADEVMTMQMQESVPVPAHTDIEFKPGGLHVMLLDLTQELKVSDTISLTLNFKEAGSRTIQVAVREP